MLKNKLIGRQYKESHVDVAFQKAKALTREETLQKTRRDSTKGIVLSLRYHPALPNISPIVRKHWKVLTHDPDFKRIFPDPPVVSYQRAPNLRDILIRAKVPRINLSSNRPKRASAHTGFKPCGKRVDCQVCPRSEASLTHKSLRTGREWPIKSAISCSDEFVIYCITCIKDTGICASSPHQYIGSTSNMAKTRLSKHIGSATLDSQADTTKPVGRHFRLPGHDSSHMKFLVFEKVFSRDRHVLEARERFWREQYDCTNNGLNVNRT